MLADKSPAFSFYAKEWISDTREFPPEIRGALVDLMAFCWENGSVPDTSTAVATLVGVPLQRVNEHWIAIRSKFGALPDQPGRMFYLRLEVEREKQKENRAQKSAAGKASAESRARKRVNERFNGRSTGVATDVSTKPQREVNLPSASPFAVEDPPLSPVGGNEGALNLSAPTPKPTRGEKQATARALHRRDAEAVIEAINGERARLRLGGPIRPTDGNIAEIVKRLRDGATPDECRHVVTVGADEVEAGGEERWFNPATLFRASTFPQRLAMQAKPRQPPALTPAELAESDKETVAWAQEGLRKLGEL